MTKTVTDYILSKTTLLEKKIEPCKPVYSQFNSGSVEIEVAEFLYTLVRLKKPNLIVETGTHKGISALYMGLACEANQKGHVDTYEIVSQLQKQAQTLWEPFEMAGRIKSYLKSSLKADKSEVIDILFLDSEPNLRFDEFVFFWPRVSPGGFIIIHDLHHHLGHQGITQNGKYDWPYGDFRPKIGQYIKNFNVQTFGFPTGRGLTFFQKESSAFGWTKYLRGM